MQRWGYQDFSVHSRAHRYGSRAIRPCPTWLAARRRERLAEDRAASPRSPSEHIDRKGPSTRDAREPDQLETSLDKIMGGFWIIVNELASVNPQTGRSDSAAAPSAFILRPSEDWTLAHRGRKTAVSPSGCSPPARIAGSFSKPGNASAPAAP